MASESFEFTEPDRVTVGDRGHAGSTRVLAAGAGRAKKSPRSSSRSSRWPRSARRSSNDSKTSRSPTTVPSDLDLRPPLEVAWVVGAMGLGYLDALDRIVLDAAEAVPVDEEGEPAEPAAARAAAAHPCPSARACSPRRRTRRRRPSTMPALRPPARSRRSHVSEDQRPPRTRAVDGSGRGRRRHRGPDAVELEHDAAHHRVVRRRVAARRLQAGARRTAAVGLPERSVASRDRDLRRQRGARLGPRARDDRPRSTRRWARLVATLRRRRRLRAALLHAVRERGSTTTGCARCACSIS